MFCRLVPRVGGAVRRSIGLQRLQAAPQLFSMQQRSFASEEKKPAAQTHSDENELLLHFSTPYDIFYDKAPIQEITIPTVSGNFTLAANSAPYVAQLKPGRVSVYREDGEEPDHYVIPGGFFIVNADGSVSLSAPEALKANQIDGEKARAGLAAARRLQSEGGATEEARVNQWYGEIGEDVFSECVFAVEDING